MSIYIYPKNQAEHSQLIPTWRISLRNEDGKKIYIDTHIEVHGKEGSRDYLAGEKRAKQMESELKTQIKLAKKTERSKEEALSIANLITGITPDTIHVAKMPDYISPTLAKSSKRVVKVAVNRFIRFAAKKKIVNIGDITFEDVEKFVSSMVAEELKANSIRVILVYLSTVYGNALPKIKDNPFKDHNIHTSKLDKETNRKPLSMEQIDRVMEVAKEKHVDLYEFIFLAIRTGQRKGDIATVRWQQIDFVNNTITFIQKKTGEEVVIPFFEKMKSVLEGLKARRGEVKPDDYVFPLFADFYNRHSETLTNWVKAAIKKALGVECSIMPSYGKRRVSVYDIHALRTSFVVNLAKAKIPIEAIAKFTGHRTLSTIVNHYLKTTAIDYADSVKAVLG